MTPAALAANRANAARGGRPVGVMDAQRLSFRDRCRRNDERHVEILEYIAEHDTNTGFRLTAIRDLFDRGHGRPNQPLEGSGPGGSIPFQVVLQWLSITMKTKARLFYFASSLLPKWGLEWAADEKIDRSVI